MQPESLNMIREKFLAFFESKGHLRLPSFSLVPREDPSILLINAGMTPLKPFFTGARKPPCPRVTTCQKCIRTPDIERVGKTARHGTFFEMLGNFSFGDYFKKEAILWAWEFCTEVLQMPEDKLYVSVFEEDDEAYAIWQNDVGLPEAKIYRSGRADNFWEHGTGPCGPCSEIHFDRGADKGCGRPDCHVGCDCDRFVELWNLVFTQFNRQEDGTYTPLAQKNIDTGAGLERMASIMQGVDSLFEVDTIRAILDYVCARATVAYGRDAKTDTAVRVITDHIRSTVMMISDGIIPSNEGRGYVLRRLLRRAARYGLLIGIQGTFLHDVARIVIRESTLAYPELGERSSYLHKVIKTEEERFAATIQQGSAILDSYLAAARQAGCKTLSGAEIFRLHDTFGFPLDLTREIAAEQDVLLDEDGFHREMNRQKEMARKALQEKSGSAWSQASLPESAKHGPPTVFTGYDTLTGDSEVLFILIAAADGTTWQLTDEAEAGQAVRVITSRTPFYGASGGQAGDTGSMANDNCRLTVQDTTKTPDGIVLHAALVEEGVLQAGDMVHLAVDADTRLATARNHTATHLLHKALRQILGDHVAQAGSAVSPERLRFDFSHFQPLTVKEKSAVEQLVNEEILRNDPVTTLEMTLEEARSTGATALFEEKYGQSVRVVSIGQYSRELCGGTHLHNTAEACLFRLVSEGGIASGIRRIEAVTGLMAWQSVQQQDLQLQEVLQKLKTTPQDLVHRVDTLLKTSRQMEKELNALKVRNVTVQATPGDAAAGGIPPRVAVTTGVELGKGIKIQILTDIVQVDNIEQLRSVADHWRDKLGECVVVLGANIEGKPALVAMASPSAITDGGVHAGSIIKAAARLVGGSGGGRADMAQAGGREPEHLEAAIAEAGRLVALQLASCKS